jgi:hypothetical protein
MTAKLRQFIQEEYAVVGQRHVAWHRHLAAPDQPDIRDGVMGGAKPPRRNDRRAVTGEASNTMDARRLSGFSQGHLRQDGGAPPCQLRRA